MHRETGVLCFCQHGITSRSGRAAVDVTLLMDESTALEDVLSLPTRETAREHRRRRMS
ncbi:hypothetical protein GCM10020220_107250 [Nonomuraea rubra]